MFEAIIGGVIAILLSVIANMVTPYFQSFFNVKSPPIPDFLPEPTPQEETTNVEEWRAQNRRKLEDAAGKVYFYGFSYFAMYLAFYIPIALKGGILEPTVNLQESKLAIDYVITNENLSKICAVFGVLAYFPFWKLSQIIAGMVRSIVINFTFVNEIKYLAFTVLAMVFWAFFIAGNVSWVLNESLLWFDSVQSSLFLWLLLFLLIFGNEKKT